jgi:hypothetical protein
MYKGLVPMLLDRIFVVDRMVVASMLDAAFAMTTTF